MSERQVPATQCIPVIMRKVCAWARGCECNEHDLTTFNEGQPIPDDACPIHCGVANVSVTEATYDGLEFCLKVQYTVTVVFTYSGGIGMATGTFNVTVCIPANVVPGGCIVCTPPEFNVCGIIEDIRCCKAVFTVIQINNAPVNAIHVEVQKKIFAEADANAIVCLPVCTEQCIELPEPTQPGGCAGFSQPCDCCP
ncbi:MULTISPECIES: hypothetical protein [Carboxydocella]|uniref:SipL SPOCS domain-containing protein n=2 Tax=Carboxydocella TaxID=178898 RepID=A0A1T4S6R2_9FIRM|nr:MULTISPECIES: hypothetical protein [Carboxydocella]AVX20683.1 hypothetical protein CFE_1505 [Carboxydocella thermautotrophica]AVX31102.1 hypothetical protein CTH_1523 [Carboxydocella thermautotrophica]SKA24010.1 hypothetical protein SAMN02745885_02483 [Carboxydocella sporoproducens DSM 16521]GAW28213.1 hypothetical protein ULO1_07830 [Carboxydocella sp. ULO1]GAW32820.1 hypothetical protein JDF658_25850 [Carboxydocella sp. JDF658]